MSQELLRKVAQSSLKSEMTDFGIGDTVNVSVRIIEGDKERIQVFRGVVIGRSGGGIAETVTVRRMVGNEGVERVFPIHSPKVAGIEVVREGRVRRAKLYYLRNRVGKATRITERQGASKRQRPRQFGAGEANAGPQDQAGEE